MNFRGTTLIAITELASYLEFYGKNLQLDSPNVIIEALKKTKRLFLQGIDDSAHKPAVAQDMKNYHLAPYLGSFGTYLIPQ